MNNRLTSYQLQDFAEEDGNSVFSDQDYVVASPLLLFPDEEESIKVNFLMMLFCLDGNLCLNFDDRKIELLAGPAACSSQRHRSQHPQEREVPHHDGRLFPLGSTPPADEQPRCLDYVQCTQPETVDILQSEDHPQFHQHIRQHPAFPQQSARPLLQRTEGKSDGEYLLLCNQRHSRACLRQRDYHAAQAQCRQDFSGVFQCSGSR